LVGVVDQWFAGSIEGVEGQDLGTDRAGRGISGEPLIDDSDQPIGHGLESLAPRKFPEQAKESVEMRSQGRHGRRRIGITAKRPFEPPSPGSLTAGDARSLAQRVKGGHGHRLRLGQRQVEEIDHVRAQGAATGHLEEQPEAPSDPALPQRLALVRSQRQSGPTKNLSNVSAEPLLVAIYHADPPGTNSRFDQPADPTGHLRYLPTLTRRVEPTSTTRLVQRSGPLLDRSQSREPLPGRAGIFGPHPPDKWQIDSHLSVPGQGLDQPTLVSRQVVKAVGPDGLPNPEAPGGIRCQRQSLPHRRQAQCLELLTPPKIEPERLS